MLTRYLQDRLHNTALTVFWDFWWPLIFVAYPFLGRIWCAVCPFMIYGELVQQWRLRRGAVLRRWPRAAMDRAGYAFLLALFTAILAWEEVSGERQRQNEREGALLDVEGVLLDVEGMHGGCTVSSSM